VKKFFKYLRIGEELLVGLLFIAGVLVFLIAIASRYIMGHQPPWTNEYSMLFMTWAIFLGFGVALKENRHIQVDLLFDKLPPIGKRIMATIANIIGAGFSFLLVYYSILQIDKQLSRPIIERTLETGIPKWIIFLIIPISFALMGLYFIGKAVRAAQGNKHEFEGEKDQILAEVEQELQEEEVRHHELAEPELEIIFDEDGADAHPDATTTNAASKKGGDEA
jgi:C4-dicarboxylate transporter DctQ subunit